MTLQAARDEGVGFFGKLPAHGDFVQRRLPAALTDAWDAHFRSVLLRPWMRAMDAREPAPASVWRFLLPAASTGTAGLDWAGVAAPGRDRVGRAYPSLLALPVRGAAERAAVLGQPAWFDRLEAIHRQVQADPQIDGAGLERLCRAVADPRRPRNGSASAIVADRRHWRWHGVIGIAAEAAEAERACLEAAWALQEAECGGNGSLWWRRGGDGQAAVLLTRGLPGRGGFARLRRLSAQAPQARSAAASAQPAPAEAGPAAMPLPQIASLPVVAVASSAPSLATPSPPHRGGGCHRACIGTARLAVVAADRADGTGRIGAAAVLQRVREGGYAGLAALRSALLALHPPLRDRGEDLIAPVAEDVAVVAAWIQDSRLQLLRIGAAGAWRRRDGAVAGLMDAVHADAAHGGGLGVAPQPYVETAESLVRAGDRLLLHAGASPRAPSAELAIATEALAHGGRDCPPFSLVIDF